MSRSLDKLSIHGFKSIRELKDFPLHPINILIGANGAGKSNLVDFFRMLRAMADGRFQKFVTDGGGADGFFFNGPRETKEAGAEMTFGQNQFRFTLESNVANEMVLTEEGIRYTGGRRPGDWYVWEGIVKESRLPKWKNRGSNYGDYPSAEAYVYDAVLNWMVYHYHDTSRTAPMRRDCSARDFRELAADAGNIAAFLLKMQEQQPARYQRIRETVQLIAPFFDDFLLEPQAKGDNELVRLEWRQKGSTFPFQPWQLSDGTLRFICLTTALLQPTPPSTIVVDEPELGLHPVALEALSALIHETSQRTQLIVSTQSAPLLDHFEPEHVVVVERVEGASVFRRLERDDLEHWITDYSLGQLLRKNVIETGPARA
jgi:predicted ATPase